MPLLSLITYKISLKYHQQYITVTMHYVFHSHPVKENIWNNFQINSGNEYCVNTNPRIQIRCTVLNEYNNGSFLANFIIFAVRNYHRKQSSME